MNITIYDVVVEDDRPHPQGSVNTYVCASARFEGPMVIMENARRSTDPQPRCSHGEPVRPEIIAVHVKPGGKVVMR